MLNDDEVKTIQERHENATSGPWENCNGEVLYIDSKGWKCNLFQESRADYSDAEFIGHARQDIPLLLADRAALEESCANEFLQRACAEEEAKQYKAERDHWKKECENLSSSYDGMTEHYARLEYELDEEKSKCKALEQVIKEHIGCGACVKVGTMFKQCKECFDDILRKPHWKFDASHFSKG